jgi:predicted DCC family thiol-disulfide oxidoreductase YuxK
MGGTMNATTSKDPNFYYQKRQISIRIKCIVPKEHINKGYFVIYDGDCGFCQRTVNLIKKFDWLHKFNFISFQDEKAFKTFKELTPEMCQKEIFLVKFSDNNKKYFPGYDAFKMMTLFIPVTMLFSWFFFLPGIVQLGRILYKIVAKNRHRIKLGDKTCKTN